jgi:predicted ATPase/DNA-binding SARP family transcriptional activator
LEEINSGYSLEIYLIGRFRLGWGAITCGKDELPQRKGRDLLKLLALEPSHRLHREQVMDILWPESPPENAVNSLYNLLYLLRKELKKAGIHEGEVLKIEEEIVQFESCLAIEVDLTEFHTAADKALLRRDLPACKDALELAHGGLLDENRYDDWAFLPRQEFQQKVVQVQLCLGELLEEQGDWEAASRPYNRVLVQEPLEEKAYAGIMRAYAQKGQPEAALRQYKILENLLQAELGAIPSAEVTLLARDIQSGKYPGTTHPSPEGKPAAAKPGDRMGLQSRRNLLPAPVSSFIGREAVLEEVIERLGQQRLLTLAGAGGVGKTRLAIAAARSLLDHPGQINFPDGIWYLELVYLSDPGRVLDELAHLFGISYTSKEGLLEFVTDHLRDQQALLVVENCEFVVQSVAQLVNHLLTHCAGLRVLATSREVLGIDGEAVYYVPPLSFADPAQLPSPEIFSQLEATRLFCERARVVLPGFQINSQNAYRIAHICQGLDGLPLALEMAAARLDVLSLEQLDAQLFDALKLLRKGARVVPDNHQTLRASLDWSYALLDPQEAHLLQLLSLFSGGCSLKALQAVSAGRMKPHESIQSLVRLVEKSLVYTRLGQTGERRYHLLVTVYQYAQEKLQESGQLEHYRRLHRDYYRQMAIDSRNGLWTGERLNWMHHLTDELDNLRAAIEWSYRDPAQAEKGLWMAEALTRPFMVYMGIGMEAKQWLLTGLELECDPPIPDLLRARVLGSMSLLCWAGGDDRSTELWAERAIQLCQHVGIEANAEHSWSLFILASLKEEEHDTAFELAERGVELARNLPELEKWYLAEALRPYSIEMLEKNEQRAFELMQEKYQMHLAMGDRWRCANALILLGWKYYCRRKEYDMAVDHLIKAINLMLEAGDRQGIYEASCILGHIYEDKGDIYNQFKTLKRSLEAIYPSVDLRNYLWLTWALGIMSAERNHARKDACLEDFLQTTQLLSFTNETLLKTYPDEYTGFVKYDLIEAVDRMQQRLSPDEFEAAWQKGAGLSLGEVVALALSIDPEKLYAEQPVFINSKT